MVKLKSEATLSMKPNPQPQPADPLAGLVLGRIKQINCSNGDIFENNEFHSIEPFSTASFIVKFYDRQEFVIIPTRCVDRIWMQAE